MSRIIPVLTAVLALIACDSNNGGLGTGEGLVPTKGFVEDERTGKPIPGVAISVNCTGKDKLHGREHLGTYRTLTDSSGAFRFESKNLEPCHSASFSASKEGYIISQKYSGLLSLNAKWKLTPVEDERRQIGD